MFLFSKCNLIDGLKIVSVCGQKIINKEKIFCCWKERLYPLLDFFLYLIVVLILFFKNGQKKTFCSNLLISCKPLSSEGKNSQPAPDINIQHGRFFITVEESEARINTICFQMSKIQSFAKFVSDNYTKMRERHFVAGDLYMFAEFLSVFLTKEFVDPKGMFRKICRQHPFEFLLMFDLCREA